MELANVLSQKDRHILDLVCAQHGIAQDRIRLLRKRSEGIICEEKDGDLFACRVNRIDVYYHQKSADSDEYIEKVSYFLTDESFFGSMEAGRLYYAHQIGIASNSSQRA